MESRLFHYYDCAMADFDFNTITGSVDAVCNRVRVRHVRVPIVRKHADCHVWATLDETSAKGCARGSESKMHAPVLILLTDCVADMPPGTSLQFSCIAPPFMPFDKFVLDQ